MADFPTRGRSPYVPGHDGNADRATSTSEPRRPRRDLDATCSERSDYPSRKNHTQWPGTGRMGDKVFDDFVKTQVQFAQPARRRRRWRALLKLLDTIGSPVIIFAHSQGGGVAGRRRSAAEPGEGT